MNDLNVFASATINGGDYNKIRIFGTATVNGNLRAESMKVNGSSEFNGVCEINDVTVNGACEFNEMVKTKALHINGACEFNHDVSVDHLKVNGSVEFNKKVFRASSIVINGSVRADVLESDSIVVKGKLECKEQLNADVIEITSNATSTIKEMVGEKITVKPPVQLFYKPKGQIRVDMIEGDEIELTNVNAKVVRGNKVIIGPDCQIGLVEFSGSLSVSNKSQVDHTEQV
jgi:cytoskeletal protein CcmA (bactofilin family)